MPGKPAKFGPFLGLKVDELPSATPSRRRRGGGRGRGASEGGPRWALSPVRPRLAVCLEFRISALRVVIPGRDGYERDLLKHLGEDIPDQVRAAERCGCCFRGARGECPGAGFLRLPTFLLAGQSTTHGLLSAQHSARGGDEQGRMCVVSRATDTRSTIVNIIDISSFRPESTSRRGWLPPLS